MRIKARNAVMISAVIAIGILVRAYVAFVIRPITGDTAVFALMAKHIFELKELYIYMPMAHYAGALYSYISSALFAISGVSYNSYMIVGVLSSCMGLIIGCAISNKILDGFGAAISDLLIAIPAFGMIYYSLYIGGNAENFLFIPALLLLAIKLNRGEYAHPALFMLAAGIVSGLALWSTPGSLPAVLTIATLLLAMLIRKRPRPSGRHVAIFFAGITLGYAPAIIYNFRYPGATLFRMAGRVLDLDRGALSDPQLFDLIFKKICWKISTIPASLAHIPHSTAGLISFPVTALLFISIAVSFAASLRKFREDGDIDDMGVILIYVFSFVLFHVILVGEAAARYMAPLCIAAPFLIASALSRFKKGRLFFVFIIALLVAANVWAMATEGPARHSLRYTKLTDWLIANNALYGYSDYDTAYIVQFESKEQILVSPTLFHPTFCDRWPENTKMVRSAGQACYIIDGRLDSDVIGPFEKKLAEFGREYKKDRIGDFTVYRGSSAELRPEDLVAGK